MSAALTTARSLVVHWPFARAMATRELTIINKGSVLGAAWLVARPLIQVAAYVIIVTVVFGARLSPTSSPLDYALYALSGLVAWQSLQKTLEEAPSLVRDRMEIVKQIAYPVETLPVSAMLASAIGPALVLAVFLLLAGLSGQLGLSLLLLPVPLALLALLGLGLSWILMIAGVVLKDLREMVAVVLGLLVYVSPVLLTREMVGDTVWTVAMLNPLAHVVVCWRDVLLGQWHPLSWAVFVVMALASFALGAWLVQRTKITINEYL